MIWVSISSIFSFFGRTVQRSGFKKVMGWHEAVFWGELQWHWALENRLSE